MKKSLALAMAMALGVTASAYAAEVEIGNASIDVSGNIRLLYTDSDADGYGNTLRTRVFVSGQINEDWTVTAMAQSLQNRKGETEDAKLKRVYAEGKLGGTSVIAGRYNAFWGEGAIMDDNVDGVEVSYGGKYNFTAIAGDYDNKDYFGVIGTTTYGDVTLTGTYVQKEDEKSTDKKIAALTAATTLEGIDLAATYLRGGKAYEVNGDYEGFMATASYNGADAAEVGTWGLFAAYYDQAAATVIAHTTDANTFDGSFKGYGIGGDYTVAKNLVATIAYYDTEAKDSNDSDKIIWTDLTYSF